MRGFVTNGKQVKDVAGEHFADAVSDVAAKLICAALNWRNHKPVIHGQDVICSRCQSVLPDDGAEPCVPRTPRCNETPDLFGTANSGEDHEQVQQVRPARIGGPKRGAAVLPASVRSREKA